MNSIIYDYYGIYVENIDNNRFYYRGKNYLIVLYHDNAKTLLSRYRTYEIVFSRIQIPNYQLVINKFGEAISDKYVLFCYEEYHITLNDITNICNIHLGTMTLDRLKRMWIQQLDQIENRCINNIMKMKKNFDYLYALSIYYLGMGETALSYLNDYFSTGNHVLITLVFNADIIRSYDDLLNPLYYHLDARVLMIANLYRLSYISVTQIDEMISMFTRDEIILLFTVVLYPSYFFRQLQLFVDGKCKEEYFLNLYSAIELHEKRINDLYFVVKKYVDIRPVQWLL